MSEQNKPIRKYLEYPAVIDWLQYSDEFEERIDKPYMPQIALTMIAEMRSDLKNSVPLDVVMGLADAHKRTTQVIGNFLDRITFEAVAKPELSTAHLGMIEAIHSYKRSEQALDQFEAWQKEQK